MVAADVKPTRRRRRRVRGLLGRPALRKYTHDDAQHQR